MTLTTTEIAALLHDLHIDNDTDDEACPWCDQPVTNDEAADYCRRLAVFIHTQCHYETGCRCL